MELFANATGVEDISADAIDLLCWCGNALTREEVLNLPIHNGNRLCSLFCIARYRESCHVGLPVLP